MTDLSPKDARAKWQAGEVSIVDVREPDEIKATRVSGMLNIPMSELQTRIDELPEGPLAVFCRSGNRSGQVADYLNGLGEYGEVANIEGGILAWAAEGLPYEGSTPQ